MTIQLLASAKRRVYELLRAMLCNVSWNFRAVWMKEITPKSVSLYFLLEVEDEVDWDAIEDIVSEFLAQQDTRIDLDVQINVSPQPISEFAESGYLVYARRET